MASLNKGICIVFWGITILSFGACRNFGKFWENKDDKSPPGISANPNQVIAPVTTPSAGSYNTTQSVSISSATSGATICYTDDGVTTPACDEPTATCITGNTYSAALSVSASQTIQALACKAGMTNSNVVISAYTIDSTPPVISAVSPTNSAIATTTAVNYTFSETCSTASITWTRTGGTPDGASPHTIPLVGSELIAGLHSGVTLTITPPLVSGTIYSVTFNCTDTAGNMGTAVTSTNVLFDNDVPVISSTQPAPNTYATDTKVSYTFSESCSTASITWTRTGGTADGASPHVQALTGGELAAGAHTNVTLSNNPVLVGGTIYTVKFDCGDAAGHIATSVVNSNVTFDNTVPVISAVQPTGGASVNHTRVDYTFSEVCASATITWTRTGGAPDGASPHAQALTGGELVAGVHTNVTLANSPSLVSGAIYDIAFNCTDAAGHIATPVTVNNVTFNTAGVVISAVSPASSSAVNHTKVSYTFSAACQTASITWTRTGGAADGSSPHVQALVGVELTAGAHTNTTITNTPTLVDSAVYSLQFDCTDAASNVSTPIVMTGVTYDTTAPVISGAQPVAGTYVNNTQVSYTFSETCATAFIQWTRTSGATDPSSPHNKALTATELNSGAHNNIIITNAPTLVSGAVYTMDYTCTDAAGNNATAVSVSNITFDTVLPNVVVQNLRTNSTVHSGFVIGTATDNLNISTVEVKLDAGAWTTATYAAGVWKAALPTGASTWRDRSQHTIEARATDMAGNTASTAPITIHKGNNRDVNGDGYSDFATAGWKHPTGTGIGKIYLFYGDFPGIANGNASAAPRQIVGEATGNNFGRNSAIGDLNGDGYADLVVSAANYSSNTGRVYIFYGSSSGISITSAAAADKIITGTASEYFGAVPYIGDANNDGFGDLIVGANGYNTNQGRVYIFHASLSGISATASSAADRILTGEASPVAQFGIGIFLGDFNGDTYTDIAVAGSQYSSVNGRGYIFMGTVSGIATATAAPTNAFGTGTSAEAFTGALSGGDFNGDGYTDLAVGAYANATNTGKMYVYYGSASGIPLNKTANPGSPQAQITGTNTGAFFTTSITAANFNADAYDDIVVGSYGCTSNPEGCAYVFYGNSSYISSGTASIADLKLAQGASGDYFGRGVGNADINGDGYIDALVGANKYNSSDGTAYIFSGGSSGVNASPVTTLTGETGQQAELGISFNR
ncbi:MAG: hypothetical protein LDLANPLL_00043 [Turneriella sp.]|nr:hypothetical protein [Turneriella sp.]